MSSISSSIFLSLLAPFNGNNFSSILAVNDVYWTLLYDLISSMGVAAVRSSLYISFHSRHFNFNFIFELEYEVKSDNKLR